MMVVAVRLLPRLPPAARMLVLHGELTTVPKMAKLIARVPSPRRICILRQPWQIKRRYQVVTRRQRRVRRPIGRRWISQSAERAVYKGAR